MVEKQKFEINYAIFDGLPSGFVWELVSIFASGGGDIHRAHAKISSLDDDTLSSLRWLILTVAQRQEIMRLADIGHFNAGKSVVVGTEKTIDLFDNFQQYARDEIARRTKRQGPGGKT